MKKIDVPINNFWYKLVALAMALLLWFYVMQTQSNVTDFALTVPLEYQDLPQELVITNEPEQIRIRVQSNGGSSTISAKDVQAFVDLSAAKIGKNQLSVEVVVPNNFQVISVTPAQVEISIEQEQSRQLPVEVEMEFATSLPKNKRVLDAVATPAEILVFGAQSRLNQIDRVVVTANITGFEENYLGTVPVQIFDKNNKLLNEYFTLMPSVVDVLVPIVDEAPSKKVPVSVPTVGAVASGYHIGRIVADPDIVTISGEYEKLENISFLYTEPVDVSGKQEKITTKRKLSLPEGVTVNGSSEINVIVEILEIEQEEQQTVSDISVQMTNLGEGLQAKISPEKVNVAVKGSKDAIRNLKAGEIHATVNLNGLDEGKHQVDIIIQLPTGLQLVDQSAAFVEVEISGAGQP